MGYVFYFYDKYAWQQHAIKLWVEHQKRMHKPAISSHFPKHYVSSINQIVAMDFNSCKIPPNLPTVGDIQKVKVLENHTTSHVWRMTWYFCSLGYSTPAAPESFGCFCFWSLKQDSMLLHNMEEADGHMASWVLQCPWWAHTLWSCGKQHVCHFNQFCSLSAPT